MSLFAAFDRLTWPGRVLILGGLAVGGFFALKAGAKYLPKSAPTASAVIPSGAIDTTVAATNKVNVRINVWVGCAPGLVANGGLDTTPESIYAKSGLDVHFKIIDDWTEGTAALATGNVDVMLTTADVWAKDAAQLASKGFSGHAFFLVDWSRGADGVMAANGINSIEDLAGKTIAFAPYTPSHFLLWNGLRNSGLSTTQRNEIMAKAVHTKDGIEPATLFAQQKVDAGVAWEPDMGDSVAKRPGSKIVYSTKIANKLIADVLVVSDAFAAKNPGTVAKLAAGWLEGVKAIKAEPARAYNLLGSIKDMNIPADLAKTMLEGVYLADYGSNMAFFEGEDSPYVNIFKSAQEMYREDRSIKGMTDPKTSFDTRFLASLTGFSTESSDAVLTYKAPVKGDVAFATQHRTIYFTSGSATISPDSLPTINEIGKFMQGYENTVVSIDGNTDSMGARPMNMSLSKARAEAVREYLISKFKFPAARLLAKGNGPDKPMATNDTPEGREQNRRTDIKVYANK